MVSNPYIEQMAEAIVLGFNPLRIILFGSHARGTPTADSDVDFLVVLPKVENARLSAIRIREALAKFPLPKDIIVTSPDEIAERGDLIGSILRPALREGRVIYERR
jgi:predicted nucleotidyltransferase